MRHWIVSILVLDPLILDDFEKKGGVLMNRKLFVVTMSGSLLLGSTLVLGNPATLPNHPGYPMGDAKDPVTGQSVANDPGQSQPSHEESLQGAGQFHDSHSMNLGKEVRPNIVPPDAKASKTLDTKSKSDQ